MDKHYNTHSSDGEPPRGFWAGLISTERRKEMDLFNFIMCLTAGAVIGWYANRMISSQHGRRANKPTPSADGDSEKS